MPPSPLPPACSALAERLPPGLSLRELAAREDDRQALLDHWLALEPDGLFFRFFHAPDPDALRRRAMELDFGAIRVAGIFAGDGELVCVAQWAPESAEVAELAFSTLPGRRQQGLAKVAAGACALDARAAGFRQLRVETLRKNTGARKLSASMGGQVEPSEEAWSHTVVSYIDLRAAIEASLGPGALGP